MADVDIGLFDKFAIKNWYRYLLYVAGVMLVLSMFFDAKIEFHRIINFSFMTIILCIILWIADDIIRGYLTMLEDENRISYINEMDWFYSYFTLHIIVFIIWLIGTYVTLIGT